MAAELGRRLNGFGPPGGSKDSSCAMGRLGMALFPEGPYPAVFLFLTVSADSAFMWTWLGPNPTAAEVQQALQVIVTARHRA